MPDAFKQDPSTNPSDSAYVPSAKPTAQSGNEPASNNPIDQVFTGAEEALDALNKGLVAVESTADKALEGTETMALSDLKAGLIYAQRSVAEALNFARGKVPGPAGQPAINPSYTPPVTSSESPAPAPAPTPRPVPAAPEPGA